VAEEEVGGVCEGGVAAPAVWRREGCGGGIASEVRG